MTMTMTQTKMTITETTTATAIDAVLVSDVSTHSVYGNTDERNGSNNSNITPGSNFTTV